MPQFVPNITCPQEIICKNRLNILISSLLVPPCCCLVEITAVRLKVEENQLVGVFDEICVQLDGLQSA